VKKATKPGSAKKPAPKPSAKKSSTKPKPRKAQGQSELDQVVAQQAMSAEKLEQAAERLAEATMRNSQAGEWHDEILKTPELPGDETAEEGAADIAASLQQEVLDAPDVIAPEGANATDFKALRQYHGIPDPSKDGYQPRRRRTLLHASTFLRAARP